MVENWNYSWVDIFWWQEFRAHFVVLSLDAVKPRCCCEGYPTSRVIFSKQFCYYWNICLGQIRAGEELSVELWHGRQTIDVTGLEEAKERIRQLEAKLMSLDRRIPKAFPTVHFLSYRSKKRILVGGLYYFKLDVYLNC